MPAFECRQLPVTPYDLAWEYMCQIGGFGIKITKMSRINDSGIHKPLLLSIFFEEWYCLHAFRDALQDNLIWQMFS